MCIEEEPLYTYFNTYYLNSIVYPCPYIITILKGPVILPLEDKNVRSCIILVVPYKVECKNSAATKPIIFQTEKLHEQLQLLFWLERIKMILRFDSSLSWKGGGREFFFNI